jgi:phage terminase small subunit
MKLENVTTLRYTNPMKPKRNPTSVRLTDEAIRLMRQLSDALGISQSSVMELALRQMAQREIKDKLK